MGPAAAYIAVSITALSEGGPTLLATLVLISALPLLRVARRLRRLRRILTPTVSSTIIMLIPVTLAPVIFDLFGQEPAGTPPVAAPLTAGVTLAAIMVLTLRTRGVARVWAPVIGVLAGCVVGALFGTYDVQRVMDAHWIGLPRFSAWPGLDFSALGRHFWLLPSFMFLSLAGAVETVGDAIAIQKVSWRRPRATDYTLVQNAVATDGVGNLLSGLAGTLPTTTYSTSVGIAEITGVAARRVGVFVGLLFLVLAFFPKVVSLLLAIPNAVAGAFTLALAAVLFTLGIKLVVASGLDYRKGVIVGISFWVGVGFQNGWLFPELLDQAGGRLGVLLGNGMTAGGIMAIVLSLILDPPGQWKRRTMELNTEAIPAVDEFVVALASRRGWREAAMTPLRAACEEVILSLKEEEGSVRRRPRVRLGAEPAPARVGAHRPRIGGAGVRRRVRERQPGGRDGNARRTRRVNGGRGNLAAPVAPLRVVHSAPEVPEGRSRDHHGQAPGLTSYLRASSSRLAAPSRRSTNLAMPGVFSLRAALSGLKLARKFLIRSSIVWTCSRFTERGSSPLSSSACIRSMPTSRRSANAAMPGAFASSAARSGLNAPRSVLKTVSTVSTLSRSTGMRSSEFPMSDLLPERGVS